MYRATSLSEPIACRSLEGEPASKHGRNNEYSNPTGEQPRARGSPRADDPPLRAAWPVPGHPCVRARSHFGRHFRTTPCRGISLVSMGYLASLNVDRSMAAPLAHASRLAC